MINLEEKEVNIYPWKNDAAMKQIFPEWKSPSNQNVPFVDNEDVFITLLTSPIRDAFNHSFIPCEDRSNYEYLGDKKDPETNALVHYFREVRSRRIFGAVAPMDYKGYKKA